MKLFKLISNLFKKKKKENRNINELLNILLNHLIEQKMMYSGLCFECWSLHRLSKYNINETLIVLQYIREKKPKYYPYDDGCLSEFGWPLRALKPRIQWLKKQIKLTSK